MNSPGLSNMLSIFSSYSCSSGIIKLSSNSIISSIDCCVISKWLSLSHNSRFSISRRSVPNSIFSTFSSTAIFDLMVIIPYLMRLKFDFHIIEVFFGYLMHGWAMILLWAAAASVDSLLHLKQPFFVDSFASLRHRRS